MVLPFRHLGVDDDILHMLHIETIPEKNEIDPIGEINRRFRTMIRNMDRSLLDLGMRHLTVILLLCCWLGLLTSQVDCWVNLLVKLTLSVTVAYSVLTGGQSAVWGTKVGCLLLTLVQLWRMLRRFYGCSNMFWAVLGY